MHTHTRATDATCQHMRCNMQRSMHQTACACVCALQPWHVVLGWVGLGCVGGTAAVCCLLCLLIGARGVAGRTATECEARPHRPRPQAVCRRTRPEGLIWSGRVLPQTGLSAACQAHSASAVINQRSCGLSAIPLSVLKRQTVARPSCASMHSLYFCGGTGPLGRARHWATRSA